MTRAVLKRKASRSSRRDPAGRKSGRITGSQPATPDSGPVHLPSTLQAVAARRTRDASPGSPITADDLRSAVRAQPGHRLIVFVVDSSDSMAEGATGARISVAKGAVMSLLDKAYLSRDRVCLISFQDGRATVVLTPTGSIDIARERLRTLPVGGSSPMAMGLIEGWNIIRRERRTDPTGRPLLVLLSDGEANTPVRPNVSPDAEVLDIALKMADDRISAVIVETGTTRPGSLMKKIASIFSTECYGASQLRAERIIAMVEAAE